MTDESKPKVVEQWMREAARRISTYNRRRDAGIIAEEFARSRPAVAAGEDENYTLGQLVILAAMELFPNVRTFEQGGDGNSSVVLTRLADAAFAFGRSLSPAPPSSDPAPGYEPPMDMMPFKAPAPRETAGAVAPEAAHAAASGDNVAGLLREAADHIDAAEHEAHMKEHGYTGVTFEECSTFTCTPARALIARLRAAEKGGA